MNLWEVGKNKQTKVTQREPDFRPGGEDNVIGTDLEGTDKLKQVILKIRL